MDTLTQAPISSLSENDLRLMRIFRIVAESGGLTAAELRLNMERSTISRHVKALEHRLGGCLCLRGPTTGFELTDFGHTVLAAAVAACDVLDRVRDDLNLARNVLTGDLVIGIADNCLSNPACRVSDAMAQLAEEAPAVRIHVVVHPPADLAREVAARQLHLCINGALQRDEDFVRHPLFREEFRLYARRRNEPLPQFEDLAHAGYGIVTRVGEMHSEELVTLLPQARRSVALGLEAVVGLVAGGHNVGLLPTHYAALIEPFCPLDVVPGSGHVTYDSPFFLNYERSRPLSASSRRFRDLVRQFHA